MSEEKALKGEEVGLQMLLKGYCCSTHSYMKRKRDSKIILSKINYFLSKDNTPVNISKTM